MAPLDRTLLRHLRVSVLVGAACASVACGATGLDWVDESHVARPTVAASSNQRIAAQRVATPSVIPATAELGDAEPPRPRLNHTVTLGEIDVVSAERAAARPDGAVGPSVTINNYNVMNASTPGYSYGYGYAGVGYGRSAPSFSAGRAPTSSAPALAPGQNWPTISDHGPSFPYHSGPASPWGSGRQ